MVTQVTMATALATVSGTKVEVEKEVKVTKKAAKAKVKVKANETTTKEVSKFSNVLILRHAAAIAPWETIFFFGADGVTNLSHPIWA